MPKRWSLLLIPLILAFPSFLYALDMGGMGMGGMGMGMGAMSTMVHIKTGTVGEVVFNHNIHGSMFQCDKCHPKLFPQKANSKHFTMQEMEKGRACGACHNGRRAFSVKKKENCVKCHTGARDILFKNADIGKLTFPHSVHIQMFDCSACHPALFKAKHGANKMTMKDMEGGKFCGACHDGDTAFSVKKKENCVKCHTGARDILFKNADMGNVTFPHSVHIQMFDCSACHPSLFKAKHGANKMTMKDMDNGKFCGACHDGDTAFSVKDACDSCHKM